MNNKCPVCGEHNSFVILNENILGSQSKCTRCFGVFYKNSDDESYYLERVRGARTAPVVWGSIFLIAAILLFRFVDSNLFHVCVVLPLTYFGAEQIYFGLFASQDAVNGVALHKYTSRQNDRD